MKFGYLWQTSLSKNRPIDADNYNKYDDGINILRYFSGCPQADRGHNYVGNLF